MFPDDGYGISSECTWRVCSTVHCSEISLKHIHAGRRRRNERRKREVRLARPRFVPFCLHFGRFRNALDLPTD